MPEVSPERAEMLAKFQQHRQALLAQLDGVSDEQASQPQPGAEGEWTIKQQLAHLALAEEVYRHCAVDVRDQDRPDLAHYWETGNMQAVDTANARPLSELIAQIESEREQTLAVIAATPDAALERQGVNTPFGDLSIGQLLRSIYRHDRMHLDQIALRPMSFVPRVADEGRWGNLGKKREEG